MLRSSTEGLPVLPFCKPKGPLEQWQGSVDKPPEFVRALRSTENSELKQWVVVVF